MKQEPPIFDNREPTNVQFWKHKAEEAQRAKTFEFYMGLLTGFLLGVLLTMAFGFGGYLVLINSAPPATF